MLKIRLENPLIKEVEKVMELLSTGDFSVSHYQFATESQGDVPTILYVNKNYTIELFRSFIK